MEVGRKKGEKLSVREIEKEELCEQERESHSSPLLIPSEGV